MDNSLPAYWCARQGTQIFCKADSPDSPLALCSSQNLVMLELVHESGEREAKERGEKGNRRREGERRKVGRGRKRGRRIRGEREGERE